MTRRLAALTLLLYPLAFRRRYGDEMRALLEETSPRARTLLDLARGALLAHLRPPAGLAGAVDVGDRLRASASGVLACWVAFAAAGFAFYKTTEDDLFEAAGVAHPLLGEAHLAVQVLAVVGSLAVVVGALPLIVAALLRARRDHGLRLLVSLPAGAVIVFAALTALLVLLAHAHPTNHPTAIGRGAYLGWELAGLTCGAVCVVASRRVLFVVPVTRGPLLAALACGTLATATMVAMALATALYAIALSFDASHLSAAPNGPLALTSTAVSLVAQLLVMTIAGALAIVTTRRGWLAALRQARAEPAPRD